MGFHIVMKILSSFSHPDNLYFSKNLEYTKKQGTRHLHSAVIFELGYNKKYQYVFGKLKSSLKMSKRTRNTTRKQIMQEPHNLIISNDIQVPNKNVSHINDKHPSEKILINSDQNISQADNKRQKCVESTSFINVNTVETTIDEIEFHRFNQMSKGQAIFQRNRQESIKQRSKNNVTRPNPISALEFGPSPVRVRHLANTLAENSAESPLYSSKPKIIPPVKQTDKTTPPTARIGSRASHRLPEPQTGEIRDYDQPDPPAGPRGHEVSSSRSGRIQGTVVSLIRYPGRSRGHKSAEPQSWQVSGHQVCRAANPGTHGPSVPETREANVKCTDVTGNNLDVRRHHHIRRQHKPKATWMSVDIVLFDGNLFL
ncbi:F-box family protein with DUF295 [Prunus dulcis]|uniref:F-box family protein with DUF295 n=1 Tax=Prunus dulcis TaxID=3755 RepID=A0A4Y1RZY0_PRUDU|nr:F-box family protein with DUF295 [Prunus dulcis]